MLTFCTSSSDFWKYTQREVVRELNSNPRKAPLMIKMLCPADLLAFCWLQIEIKLLLNIVCFLKVKCPHNISHLHQHYADKKENISIVSPALHLHLGPLYLTFFPHFFSVSNRTSASLSDSIHTSFLGRSISNVDTGRKERLFRLFNKEFDQSSWEIWQTVQFEGKVCLFQQVPCFNAAVHTDWNQLNTQNSHKEELQISLTKLKKRFG